VLGNPSSLASTTIPTRLPTPSEVPHRGNDASAQMVRTEPAKTDLVMWLLLFPPSREGHSRFGGVLPTSLILRPICRQRCSSGSCLPWSGPPHPCARRPEPRRLSLREAQSLFLRKSPPGKPHHSDGGVNRLAPQFIAGSHALASGHRHMRRGDAASRREQAIDLLGQYCSVRHVPSSP
jgi:hypothetical protein